MNNVREVGLNVAGQAVDCLEINGNTERSGPGPGPEAEFAKLYPLKETVDHYMLRGKTEEEARAILIGIIRREAAEAVSHEKVKNEPFPIWKPSLNGDVEIGWYSGPPAKWAWHVARERFRKLDEKALAHTIIKPV